MRIPPVLRVDSAAFLMLAEVTSVRGRGLRLRTRSTPFGLGAALRVEPAAEPAHVAKAAKPALDNDFLDGLLADPTGGKNKK